MGQPPELTSPPAHSLPEADRHPAPLPPSQCQLLRPCPVTECQAASHSPCGSGVQTRRPWLGLVSVQLKWPNLVAAGRKLPLWLEVRAGRDTLEGTREGDWVPAAGISLEFRTLTLSSKYMGSKCWGGHVCAPSVGLHRSHQPVHGEEPLRAGAGSVRLTAGPQCLAQDELGTDSCFSVGRISEMAKLYVKREGSFCGPLRTPTMEDVPGQSGEETVGSLRPGSEAGTRPCLPHVCSRPSLSRSVFIGNKLSKPKGTECVVTLREVTQEAG